MTHEDTISSVQNPLIKHILQLLEKRKARYIEGEFFIEGTTITRLASSSDIRLVMRCDALVGPEGQELVESLADVIDCVEVSEDVFRRISQRNNPDGVAAICTIRHCSLDEYRPIDGEIVVALDRVSDPGNLGTILRTLDAAGDTSVILVGKSTDPYHPRTVRASRGTIFTVPTLRAENVSDVAAWAKRYDRTLVATSAHATRPYWDCELVSPIVVLFGNEHAGLSPEDIGFAELSAVIPMSGAASSLNLGIAIGLLVYEIKRQRSALDANDP